MKKGSKADRDPQKLASELEQLRELNSGQLHERWRTLFGAEPPPKLRTSLLVQGIVRERQLAVVESEAATVRHIFQRYCELGNVRLLKQELDRDGLRSKLRVSSKGSSSGAKSGARHNFHSCGCRAVERMSSLGD